MRFIREESQSYVDRLESQRLEQGGSEVEPCSTEPQIIDKPQSKYRKTKRIVLGLVLVLANLMVANVIYNVSVAEKGTPLSESIKATVVCKLFKTKESRAAGYGFVCISSDDANRPTGRVGDETVMSGHNTESSR
ncbi:MAG: hypothetical protein ACYTEL_12625 [Planctomycetota bacterium]|jgi:hypothetical protein